MDTTLLSGKVEKLESVFLNILYLKPEDQIIVLGMTILADIKNAINSIL